MEPLSDVFLDGMRQTVDVAADKELLAAVLRTEGLDELPEGSELVDAVEFILEDLTSYDYPRGQRSGAGPAAASPTAALGAPGAGDSDKRAQFRPMRPPQIPPEVEQTAQLLFERHGVKMLLVLVAYSLPAAYAARRGALVLHQSGYLGTQTARRLVETAQLVIDVLLEGGLDEGGRGLRQIAKVRRMHAAIRFMILKEWNPNWDKPDLGMPINAEDVAATLMTFSYLLLDGLKKLGVKLTAEEEQNFLLYWVEIGKRLGVNRKLLPADMDEAEELTEFVKARQVRLTIHAHTDQLTASLIKFMTDGLPRILQFYPGDRLPRSLVRFFLRDTAPKKIARDRGLQNDRYAVATSLGIKPTPILDVLVRAFFYWESKISEFALFRGVNRVLQLQFRTDVEVPYVLAFSRPFTNSFLQHLGRVDRNFEEQRATEGKGGGSRSEFGFQDLDQQWKIYGLRRAAVDWKQGKREKLRRKWESLRS